MEKKEKNKPTKKRVLLYYLILAASILIIAAVTVAVVYSVNDRHLTIDNPSQSEGDNGGSNTPDDAQGGNQDGNGGETDNKDPDDDSKGTSSQTDFIVPIREVTLAKAHVFGYDGTLDRYCLHQGMDFSAPAGCEVLAAIDGTVIAVSYKSSDILYGDSVTIQHANGLVTVYKFIDVGENVTVGTKVNRGDVIGKVATANGVENADGDHLHFEVFKDGVSTDPDDYLNIMSK